MRTIVRIRTPSGQPRGPIATTVAAPFVVTSATSTDVGQTTLVLPLNLATGVSVYITCLGAGDYSTLLTAHVQTGGGGGAWADKHTLLDPGEVLTIIVAGGHNSVASEVKKGAVVKTTICKADSAGGSAHGQSNNSVGETVKDGGDGGQPGSGGGGGGGGAASQTAAGTAGATGGASLGGAGGTRGGTAGGNTGLLSTSAGAGAGCGGHGLDVSDPAQTVFGGNGVVTITYSSIGAPHS